MNVAMEVITPAQINGDITASFTVTIRNPVDPDGEPLPCIVRDAEGRDEARDAEPGDVYSIQPDGEVQARPPGSAGPYELACLDGGKVVYAPQGATGRAFVAFAYVTKLPNG